MCIRDRRRNSRTPGNEPGGGKGVLGPETEAAIELGLVFLARHQLPEGNWSLQGFDESLAGVSAEERRFMLVSDTGATALSILAFQGGGYTHREHQYKDVVRKGLDHLVRNQKEDGDLFVPRDDRSNQSVWLYSHALATIALCEAYGMTGDPSLKDPAQKAVNFIVAAQNKDLGGWRYAPKVGTDTSVTGWMMMALKSGELAGLEVPSETYQRVSKFLDSAEGQPAEVRQLVNSGTVDKVSVQMERRAAGALKRQVNDFLTNSKGEQSQPNQYRYNPCLLYTSDAA